MGRTFYPGFQGLRGIAAVLIFLTHYVGMAYPSRDMIWGSVGVDLFFVLSGFLITGILMESRERPDYFSRFYRNRAYRIFPVFYGIWLVLFLLSPWLRPVWTFHILSLPLYLGNVFEMGRVGRSGILPLRVGHGRTDLLFGHLWSLTVEEHFYLVWPLVIWLVGSRKALCRLAAVAVILILIFRIYLVRHLSQDSLDAGLVYYSTYTRIDSILIGALLSLWVTGQGAEVSVRRRLAPWLTGVPLVLLLLGQSILPASHNKGDFDWRIQTYGFTLIAVAAAGILLSAMDGESYTYRLVTCRPFTMLGTISYSFYMLHFIPYDIWGGYMQRLRPYHLELPMLLFIFLVTCAAATLSYRWIELPFLHLRDGGRKPDEPTASKTSLVSPSPQSGSVLRRCAYLRGR